MTISLFHLYLSIACLLAPLQSSYDDLPQKKSRFYYEARGDIIWEVPTREKVIALTFDDGPDPGTTPQILDLLSRYHAKATFFALGRRVELYPEIAKREVQEGHEISNHTYNHLYFRRQTSAAKFRSDIERAQDIIVQATGVKPRLFRPPGGYYDDDVVRVAKQAGYIVVLWSWHQDTKDWGKPGVAKIVSKVLGSTRNGDIVLFHDYVKGSSQTVEALKQILPELQERGYRFVTVSELMTVGKSRPVKK